ncbi:MAG: glycosyltransferase [Hyphomonadaceae bacterium]
MAGFDLARWSGRLQRVGALAADLAGALTASGQRRHPARKGLICIIDLVQDAELVLPVAQAARASGAFEVRIVMTDWLDRVAPQIGPRVAAAGFTPIRHARDALLTGLAPDLSQWDAVLTASESTSASHRFAHALVKRAKAAGLATFTMQHGLENIGLTYAGDGDYEFASDWIFTWGKPSALPDWVSDATRARCIGVGRAEAHAASKPIAALQSETRGVVAVFENLHWARYDEAYRQSFVSDLLAAARARADLCFVVRPHPAGRFLTKNADRLRDAPENLTIADASAPDWAQASAVDLIARARAVITTPSTIALDAAQHDRPVAVAAYGLDLAAYAPLPTLSTAQDWLDVLNDAPHGEVALTAFRRRHVIEGDAGGAVVTAVSSRITSRAGMRNLSLGARAGAKAMRIIRASPLARFVPSARTAGTSRHAYQRWLDAYATLTDADRDAMRARMAAWPQETLVSVLIDARGASAHALELSRASVKQQLMARRETIVIGADAPTLAAALARAKGRYAAVLGAGDTLAEHALFTLCDALVAQPDALFAYSDEDVRDGAGRRTAPHFKPNWDPLRFAAQDYACRLALFDTDAARALANSGDDAYTLLRRMADASPARPVLHAPFVLYHRAEAEAGGDGAPQPALPAPPLVSLIVPTRDRVSLLRACVDGLLNRTDYPNLEVLIVDNGSVEPETLAYLGEIAKDARVRVIADAGAFNFSRLNNLAAHAARGEIIGLINNDIVVVEPNWLSEMAALAMRPDIGAVGAMLLYPNGKIQHAGCVLGIGGVASHVYNNLPADTPGHGDCLRVTHETSAVTAACLLTHADVWRSLHGLDEDLPVAYNDIDYCLRVRQAGRRVVWTPFARLEHHESASRGQDVSGERRARLERDKAIMRERWGQALREDPFYSPNLSLADIDASLAFPPRVKAPWRAT